MAFHFRQVIKRPGAARDLLFRVVKKHQREIEHAAGYALAGELFALAVLLIGLGTGMALLRRMMALARLIIALGGLIVLVAVATAAALIVAF